MALTPGTLINNRYYILSILGQGGMGYVYQAEDTVLKVHVAVKENLFLSEEYSRQFEREAQILAGLRHGTLPHVSDFFLIPGQGQYLIMNYIEGEDLRERIERLGTVPVEDVIRIGIAICDALNYLHTRKESILHRDIKPGNIKITPEGGLVLVDFGLAKIMHGNQATTDGARAMTPGYSPPEQYGTARTDPRSDIYALGATLYAALTGIIPEDGLDRATGKSRLTPVRQIKPDISQIIAGVIEKSLEIDPENRFQSALDFQQALMSAGDVSNLLLEGVKIAPPPPNDIENQRPQPLWDANSPIKPVNDFPIRNPQIPVNKKKTGITPVRILLALTVIIAAGLIFLPKFPNLPSIFSYLSETSTLSPDTMGLIAKTPSQVYTYTLSAPSSTPVVSKPVNAITPNITPSVSVTEAAPVVLPTITATPAGGGTGQYAFVSDRTGSYQIWMVGADGNGQQQLTNMKEGACQPAWNPDGMKLAFISPCKERNYELYPGSKIYYIDLADSSLTPQTLPVSSEEGDFDPAWSPDGNRMAFSSLRIGTAHVFVYNFADETLQEISDTRYADIHPAWNPLGTQLAVSRKIIYGHIFILSDKGYTQYQLSPNGNVEDYWPVWSRDGKTIMYSRNTQLPSFPFLVRMNEEDHGTGIETRIPPLAEQSSYPVAGAVYSQDGEWILFESWPDGRNHDIFMMTKEGGSITRLTTDPGSDFDPAWR
ncbi:MAG: serine/threonine-protein kinase [Chloroflexi bacterium]|nr:serine/threonine-protein kinase [Chloroflexota bacterium]